MTVYQQPGPPTDSQAGDIWIQTQKPTLWERWLIRRGKLPTWWGGPLPDSEVKGIVADLEEADA